MLSKTLLAMRITSFLFLATTLQVSASGSAQKISLSVKDAPLEKVLVQIKKQTGYLFFYDEALMDESLTVSVHVKDATIGEVLSKVFENQPLEYKLINKTVVVRRKAPSVQAALVRNAEGVPAPPLVVKGVVKDEGGRPLVGATVMVRGTQIGTTTNEKGEFTLNVPGDASVLVISYIDMETAEISIKGKNDIQVTLKASASQVQDVVVVGYGTQKRELLTSSVVSMKVKESDKDLPTTMLGNLLAGKMAGVSVSTPNGIPGQSSPGITIRTANSFNGQPVVFVIDGKVMGQGDFNNLSPNEVDNVVVLKDAASTAIYGSRAAGGVVLVTTNRGARGKAQINYSFNTGVDKRAKNFDRTSAVQAGQLYMQINPSSDPASWAWTQSDLDYFKNINNGWGYDQLAAVWRDPFTTTHNLSVSGGTDKVTYFIGGSSVYQKGFLDNLNYNKYNLRANVTARINKDWEVFGGIALGNTLTQTPRAISGGDYGKLLVWQPDQPVWTNSHKPIDYGWIANVGAETSGSYAGYVHGYGLKPVVNLSTTYNVPYIKGLSLKASFSKSYADNRTKYFETQYTMYVMKKTGFHIISTNDSDIVGTKLSSIVSPSFIQENATWSEDKQLDLQASYEHTFGNMHHVKGWLIYEGYESKGSGMAAGINGFPVYMTDQWWAASTNNINQFVSNSTNYSDFTNGRRSWAGQFFYDYNSKYLASFTYRYDGSMNFAPDKRWGFFPSGSVGWIISREPFFKMDKIGMLKVRASAGLIGNDNVGGWQWQTAYFPGNSAYFGASPATNAGIRYGAVVNPNLTWEKSFNTNYAVDINFLQHFNATVEYWHTYTYDILGQRVQAVPPSFSLTPPAQNYGKMKAAGIDFSLGYSNRYGKLSYYANLIASYGDAWYVLQDQNITYDWQRNMGRSASKITGYKVAGMIRTQKDLDALLAADPNYNFKGNKPALGQFIYQDLNSAKGLGVPDSVIDDYDQTILRRNNNPIVLGLNLGASWNGFSIDATFSGSVRQWKSFNDLGGGVEWNRMWASWYGNSWTPNNPNAWLPKRYSTNDGTKNVNLSGSNFWYADGSFIRLKFVNVAYSVPARLTQKVGIAALKVYFSGANLFVISGFNKKYYDPELGGGTAFPIMKSYNFGVNVGL